VLAVVCSACYVQLCMHFCNTCVVLCLSVE